MTLLTSRIENPDVSFEKYEDRWCVFTGLTVFSQPYLFHLVARTRSILANGNTLCVNMFILCLESLRPFLNGLRTLWFFSAAPLLSDLGRSPIFSQLISLEIQLTQMYANHKSILLTCIIYAFDMQWKWLDEVNPYHSYRSGSIYRESNCKSGNKHLQQSWEKKDVNC